MDIQQSLIVPKDKTNEKIRYSFRKAEDILAALKPLLAKYKCIVYTKERVEYLGADLVDESKQLPMIYLESTAYIEDIETSESMSANSFVIVDLTQKGMSMPQMTGSASSYAKKYALGNLFGIDNNKDPDELAGGNSSEPNIKPSISDERLAKAISAIQQGAAKAEHVTKVFTLTPKQLKTLNDAIN